MAGSVANATNTSFYFLQPELICLEVVIILDVIINRKGSLHHNYGPCAAVKENLTFGFYIADASSSLSFCDSHSLI